MAKDVFDLIKGIVDIFLRGDPVGILIFFIVASIVIMLLRGYAKKKGYETEMGAREQKPTKFSRFLKEHVSADIIVTFIRMIFQWAMSILIIFFLVYMIGQCMGKGK